MMELASGANCCRCAFQAAESALWPSAMFFINSDRLLGELLENFGRDAGAKLRMCFENALDVQ